MLNGGIILGALAGYLFSGEFRVTWPRFKRQYILVLAGGLLMGYGASLASGCTIGAFFSAIPSLGLNGLVFGISVAAGSFLGVKIVSRLG
jgi:hypothetical protein